MDSFSNDDLDPDINLINQSFPGINLTNNSKYYDINSINLEVKKEKDDFCVLHLNIRSIYNKVDELISLISLVNFSFDAICISESWLNSNTKDLISIPGYNAFHSLRPIGKRGGGVSIFVKESYHVKIVDNVTCNTNIIESLFLQLTREKQKLYVGTIYKPPQVNRELFLETFSGLFDEFSRNRRDPVYLCGDFNFDLLSDESLDFLTMLNSFFLIPVISKPTRITDTTMSLIDNIFIDTPSVCISGILCCDISDHLPIFCLSKNLFSSTNVNTGNKIEFRLINESNIDNLCGKLENLNFNYCENISDVSETFEKFYKDIFSAYSEACPTKVKFLSNKRLKKPWITSSILLKIKKRQNLFILYKLGRISHQYFSRFRNDVTNSLRSARFNYLKNKFDEYKNNMKKTWTLINDIMRPNKSSRKFSELKLGNSVLTRDEDMANALNEYFVNVGENIAQGINSSGEHLNFMTGNYSNSFFIEPTTAQEVFSIISGLKNKSCDPVKLIPIRVLKAINHIICHPLSKIINSSFQTGVFPSMLKVSSVVPIPKQGDLTLMENYRPISILNIFSKIIEKIMYKRLFSYFEDNSVLNNKQFGFRSKKSTSDALITNIKDFYSCLDHGKIIFSMFLDFRKAFDCVDPQILISKLRYYGVRGVASKWFESFLHGRTQTTMVNGSRSSTAAVSHGVPQGSTLGPLLFLVFINDLPNSSNFFDFTLFADDCTLTKSLTSNPSNFSSQADVVNFELCKISKWFKENKISVNYNKTKFIIFSYGRPIDFPLIHINNEIVHQTSSIRFLGVIFNHNLNFKNHIDYLSGKISKIIGILFKLRNELPSEVLLKIFKAFVQPYILYGLETWYGTHQYLRDKIFVLQKKALRCVFKLRYNAHTSSYFKSARVLKLPDLYEFTIAIIMYKTVNLNMFQFLNLELQQHSDIHSHFTRGRQNFIVPAYIRARSQKSILFTGVKILNENFHLINNSPSLRVFRSTLYDVFYDRY